MDDIDPSQVHGSWFEGLPPDVQIILGIAFVVLLLIALFMPSRRVM